MFLFYVCYEGENVCSALPFLFFVFQEARGYYEQTGVGPLPVVLFNGMPFEKEQLDPDELETITMHKILETTTFFQRAVYLVSNISTAALKADGLSQLMWQAINFCMMPGMGTHSITLSSQDEAGGAL